MSDDADRDQRVLQLFIAGATYSQIAAAVEMESTQVHDVVCRELSSSGDRRSVLSNEAVAVYQERSEALFRAHWAPALRGDHKSAEICRKILEQQSRLFGSQDLAAAPKKGTALDELAARRAKA